MAVATSIAMAVAASIAHGSTLLVGGLRLRGEAASQQPASSSSSEEVGQRVGGLVPDSAVSGVSGSTSSSPPITRGELPCSSRVVIRGKLGLVRRPLSGSSCGCG